jgi:GT2 family glycosyltransferase
LFLSVIIVNYRTTADVCNSIASAIDPSSYGIFEWIIVDNNSKDNSKELITSRFPFVQWVQMDYNAGYARANNEGIRQSKGDIVLLLNPDVLFEDDSLQRCYQSFTASDYAACCVQLLNPDKSPQISGGYFIAGGLNNLLPLPVLGRIFKWLGNLLKVKKTSLNNAGGIQEVDWINGAFIMIKKDVLGKAGLLDEDFFLYAEEIEWCSRIRRFGKICVYGDLHAIHLQGESANRAFDSSGKGYYNLHDKKGRQILVSNFLRIRKQFGVGWFLFHLLCYFVEIPFFFLLVLFRTILFFKKGYSFPKFGGYVSNLFYLFGKSGKIIRNKPYFYKVI